MPKPYLSIIIPAYNEAGRLPATLFDVNKHLDGVDFSYEIIVVNDGSTDKTAEVVRQLQPQIKNLELIDNKKNSGKGAVVRQGMLAANGDFRLFMDADNSTSIVEFQKMIPLLKQECKIIIGSRQAPGAKMMPPQPLYKRAFGILGNLWIQFWILPGMKDTQAGFKCFSREAAEKIFTLSTVSGWSFDVEILAIAKKSGYEVKEIPILWVNDVRSHVKFLSYFRFLIEVLRIRRKFKKWNNKEMH